MTHRLCNHYLCVTVDLPTALSCKTAHTSADFRIDLLTESEQRTRGAFRNDRNDCYRTNRRRPNHPPVPRLCYILARHNHAGKLSSPQPAGKQL